MALTVLTGWRVIGCCGGTVDAPCEGEAPWTGIDALAYDLDGRTYTFAVETEERFAEGLALEPGLTYVRRDIHLGYPASVWTTDDWEYPSVVVDAAEFGIELVDLLISGGEQVSRVFVPDLTEDEQAWLDDVDLPARVRMLEGAWSTLVGFGGPDWRVVSKDVDVVVAALLEAGISCDPDLFLSKWPQRISNTARKMLRDRLDDPRWH